MHNDYHISYFDPCEPHWPRGGWSVYHISADQIAEQVVFEGEWPDRKAVRRDAWCGYLGIWETLPEVMSAIEEHKREQQMTSSERWREHRRAVKEARTKASSRST
jgi:hypothetical protein